LRGATRRQALLAGFAGLASTAASAADAAVGLAGYAINLDTWCRQVAFEQRFGLARKLGFKNIEFWTVDRGNGTTAAELKKRIDDNGLEVTQFAPAWPNFADTANLDELLKTAEQAVVDAKTLGCPKFTITGHGLVPSMSREAQLAGYTAGLMRLVPLLESAQVTGLVEPFNRVNHQGHLLNGSQPALPMVRAVNSARIKLLWDFYHMQLEDGDLIEKFATGADQVGHVQIGDVPGRHQPGTGEVNYANLLRSVRAAGYGDKIGLEFMPADQNDANAVDDMLALG